MSKASKRRAAAARIASPPALPQATAQTTPGGSIWYLPGSGHQAAGFSDNRGYLYWPTTDTARQMTSLTRNEILRRIQWLLVHFGFAIRMVQGPARLLGYVIPQPNCSDEEWNDLAYDALMGILSNAEIYDIAGKFDGLLGQVQDNISVFSHGDCLAVLTETTTGRARMAFYEAHQIKSGPDSSGPGWEDGVLKSRQGKHLAYSLQDGQDPTTFTIVDAQNAIYMGNFQTRGQVRALSMLTPMVLNMIDVVETRGFTKTSIKRSSQVGTVIEQDMGPSATPTNGGAGGPQYTVDAIMPNGETQPITFEMATATGSRGLALKPGQKVKVVSDDRRSPNTQAFERDVLKDCCHAADLTYEAFFDIAGITGPGIRFLNAELKRWIALKRLPQIKRVARFAVYALAKEMKAGRLRKPLLKAGENWWQRIEYLGLADMDIDGGRTAAATLTNLQSGLTTYLDQCGLDGLFWKRPEVAFMHLTAQRTAAATGIPLADLAPQVVFPQRFASTITATTTPNAEPSGPLNDKADLSDSEAEPDGQD
jgi:hypothetical protein